MSALARDIALRYGFAVHIPVLEEEVQLTPALPVGEEELRRAYDAVASRLQDVLASGLGRGYYREIVEQLDHLNALLASIQKQAQ
jgi:metallo-beta-lactamase family protein